MSGGDLTLPNYPHSFRCSIDKFVLSQVRYDLQSSVVLAESHVFKFADVSSLHFNCQIEVCLKMDNECDRILVRYFLFDQSI